MRAAYYLGRFGQLVGMWMLLVDLFMAGPLGPSPRLFAAGVGLFLAGWGLTRIGKHRENGVGGGNGSTTKQRRTGG